MPRLSPSLFRVARGVAFARFTFHVGGEFRAAPSRLQHDAREFHFFVASPSTVLDRAAALVFRDFHALRSCQLSAASYSAVFGEAERFQILIARLSRIRTHA